MTAFVRQAVSAGETLGEKLRRLREDEGLAVEEVANRLRIAPRYITALEAGRYHELPGEVYTRNFLRSYAIFLNVQPERVFALYEGERPVAKRFGGQNEILPPRAKSLRTVVTTGVVTRLLIGVALLSIIGYLATQVYAILAPPELAVSDPAEHFVTKERTITVMGKTEPEASVTINGSDIFVDRDGYFEEVLSLSTGTHTLEITARRKRSRPSTVTRTVLVEESAAPS